jgi:hypothetical protein
MRFNLDHVERLPRCVVGEGTHGGSPSSPDEEARNERARALMASRRPAANLGRRARRPRDCCDEIAASVFARVERPTHRRKRGQCARATRYASPDQRASRSSGNARQAAADTLAPPS